MHSDKVRPGIQQLWDVVSELTDPRRPRFVRAFQRSTITQPVPPAFLEAIIDDSRKVPARVWKHALRALLDADPPTDSGAITASPRSCGATATTSPHMASSRRSRPRSPTRAS